jgi:hypothetical protein
MFIVQARNAVDNGDGLALVGEGDVGGRGRRMNMVQIMYRHVHWRGEFKYDILDTW